MKETGAAASLLGDVGQFVRQQARNESGWEPPDTFAHDDVLSTCKRKRAMPRRFTLRGRAQANPHA